MVTRFHRRRFFFGSIGSVAYLLAAAVVLSLLPVEVFAQGTGTPNPLGVAYDFIAALLWSLVVQVFGLLVWITGSFLDWSITNYIVDFGRSFSGGGLGIAVNNLWEFVRDIFNLTFIFGLVYIALRLIWDAESASAKKALINLVIAALLVNFSLFFVKAAIDFTNIAAVQIAQLGLVDSAGRANVSLAFLDSMGLQTVWQGGNFWQRDTPHFSYVFLVLILFIIAAFSFAVGGVLLLVRFIALNIFMILSPLLFLKLVLPSLGGMTDKYVKQLFSYIFFAPVFLLMIYMALRVMQAMQAAQNTQQGANRSSLFDAITGSAGISGDPAAAGGIQAFATFFIACGFLLASVIFANKLSIAGASTAINLGNKMRGSAQSFVGRNSVGRFGKYADGKLEGWGVRSDSSLRGIAKSAKEAKFGGSTSWKSASDASDERDRFMARKKAVGTISSAVTAGSASGATPDQKVAMERAISSASNEQVLKVLGGMKEGSPEYKAFIASLSAPQYDALMKAKDEDLNDGQKAAITTARQESITGSLQERARTEEANKARDTVIAAGGTAAAAEAAAAAARTGMSDDAALDKGLKKASSSQLKVLGERKLTEDRAAGMLPLATELTFSQIDDIKKSNDFTETEKERIINIHTAGLVSAFNTAASMGGIPAFLNKFKNNEEIAKLPKSILNRAEIRNHLTGGALGEIAKVLNAKERKEIRDHIIAAAATPAGHIAHDWLTNTPQGRSF